VRKRATKRRRQNPLPWAELASAVVAGVGSGLGYEISSRLADVYDKRKDGKAVEGRPLKKTAEIAKKMSGKLKTNPAVSVAQQKLFGSALAYKRGETKRVSAAAKHIAKTMSERKIKEFASTKRKGLPKKSRKNPKRGSNPKIVVVNPCSSLIREAEKGFKRKLTPQEKKALTKAVKEYEKFHGVPPSGGKMVRVPNGTPKILVGAGEVTETNYKVAFGKSDRKGFWTHKAGDHGRSKRKTKPPYLAWVPGVKGPPLFAQASGSNLKFKPTHGIVG
jgi:hypothetical protein